MRIRCPCPESTATARSSLGLLDQDVVGVIRGDDQDGDTGLGQRLCDGGKDADRVKSKLFDSDKPAPELKCTRCTTGTGILLLIVL